MLRCPACTSSWIVVGFPLKGSVSCVSCRKLWTRAAVVQAAAESNGRTTFGTPSAQPVKSTSANRIEVSLPRLIANQ